MRCWRAPMRHPVQCAARTAPRALERPFTGEAFRATLLERARERLSAQLLDLPAGYHILFLAGGAMHQFALVPMNLLVRRAPRRPTPTPATGRSARSPRRAATARWSPRPASRATRRSPRRRPGSGTCPADCAYCHITPNETVDGLAYPAHARPRRHPAGGRRHLVPAHRAARRRPLRFHLRQRAEKHRPSRAVTVAIIRDDLLERCPRRLPAPFSYRRQAEGTAASTRRRCSPSRWRPWFSTGLPSKAG
jgi:phosphoserine aminotransferase